MADLVPVPCPLCECPSFEVLFADHPSSVVRCRSCDLAYFNPQPSPGYLQAYYSSQAGYLPSAEDLMRRFKERPDDWKASADEILDRFLKHAPAQIGLKLLDVGAMYGFFLFFARERGLQVTGVELSEETPKFARSQGIDVRSTTLAGAAFPDASFDLVTMNNVLEHTLSPLTDLQEAFRVLKPGGLIYVAVPNFDSLVANVDNIYWKNKAWPNHLVYFTRKTLALTLGAAGFEVAEWWTHWGENEVAHDIRVIRDRLRLTERADIEKAMAFLNMVGKGQELVMVGKKA